MPTPALSRRLWSRQFETATWEPRFEMLETVRAYGRERLNEAGEREPTYRRHALYYLALAEEANRNLNGPMQRAWLSRLDAERDNLREALQWTLGLTEPSLAQRLAAALARYWLVRGALAEGRAWLRQA